MPDLRFEIRGAEPVREALTPALALQLEISNRPAEEAIQAIILRCQIQIESARRRYQDSERHRLRDLFGEAERWGQTLRPMLWTNIAAAVPSFASDVRIPLAIPCTFDFHVSATKYFHALQDGAVPLTLLFSGTIFYKSSENSLQVVPIPWNSEARFSLPVSIWKQCIDSHYGETAWLDLRRDVFERLYDFKVRQGLATFEEAIELMLDAKKEAAAI